MQAMHIVISPVPVVNNNPINLVKSFSEKEEFSLSALEMWEKSGPPEEQYRRGLVAGSIRDGCKVKAHELEIRGFLTELPPIPSCITSLALSNVSLSALPDNYSHVVDLTLQDCPELTCTPKGLSHLRSLNVKHCPKLVEITSSELQNLSGLQFLECPAMVDLPSDYLLGLTRFCISGWECGMSDLPEDLIENHKLGKLSIYLTSMPNLSAFMGSALAHGHTEALYIEGKKHLEQFVNFKCQPMAPVWAASMKKKHLTLATNYLTKASDAGHEQAKKGLRLLDSCLKADQGDPVAACEVGYLFLELMPAGYLPAAKEYFEKSIARIASPASHYGLGQVCRALKQESSALLNFNFAADHGHADAAYEVGVALKFQAKKKEKEEKNATFPSLFGVGYSNVRKYFKIAADQNHQAAAQDLGLLCKGQIERFWGIDRQALADARKYLLIAAKPGGNEGIQEVAEDELRKLSMYDNR